MTVIYQEWWEWSEINEEGYLIGVKEDAPKEIKEQYEEWKKMQKRLEDEGIKV